MRIRFRSLSGQDRPVFPCCWVLGGLPSSLPALARQPARQVSRTLRRCLPSCQALAVSAAKPKRKSQGRRLRALQCVDSSWASERSFAGGGLDHGGPCRAHSHPYFSAAVIIGYLDGALNRSASTRNLVVAEIFVCVIAPVVNARRAVRIVASQRRIRHVGRRRFGIVTPEKNHVVELSVVGRTERVKIPSALHAGAEHGPLAREAGSLDRDDRKNGGSGRNARRRGHHGQCYGAKERFGLQD